MSDAGPRRRPSPLADELERRREEALGDGRRRSGSRGTTRAGRLTARERLDALIDPGSWYELGLLAEPEHRRDDGRRRPTPSSPASRAIDGRKVCVIAVDATVLAGTTAPVNMRKQNRVARWAGERGLPLICLSDNDGGRIPDVMGWRFSGLPFDFQTFVQAPDGLPGGAAPDRRRSARASATRRCTPRWATSS